MRDAERAAHALTEAAACQPEIEAGVQRLLGVLNAARARNEKAALQLQGFGERVKSRTEIYAALLSRVGDRKSGV